MPGTRGSPIGKAPLRSRRLSWRKRRLLLTRPRSSLSDIKPASTNKYSIAGVRGPKYSWGNSLSLVRPVLSLSFSLSFRFLSPDRSGDSPKLGYGRREDVRISYYYRKYILTGHRWTLCASLIRSIRYYETYFLSTTNRDNR